MSSSGIVAVGEVGKGYREIFTVLRPKAELLGPVLPRFGVRMSEKPTGNHNS